MNEFFKRALILIGALLVMLPCKAIEWVGDLLFDPSSDGAILFECSSNAEGRIVIPSSVELTDRWGDTHIFKVIKIGDRAFKDCTGMTSVEIPETITEIGSDAFSGCTGLTSINLPESIT
ncbi:MAG: leucine-rich repeat domain-containing protein, partial [Muribaculaceae bacterium]|nr:leucine-rich repeat domain-containing protein [Muribaculaceae bacterium]